MVNVEGIKNSRILVVGLGRSGIAATKALIKLGVKVCVQDTKKEEDLDQGLLKLLKENGCEMYLEGTWPCVNDIDMIVLSPGVSPELDFIVRANYTGVEIIGELELAYRLGRGNYIALTGTNGKTTTTTLVGEIFKKDGRKTQVVGNIGVAVISASFEATEDEWLVTECSSFQLETVKEFSPKVSAILNLTPDHLNRHHTMEAYGAAKAKIFANQNEEDFLVTNYDDKSCYNLSSDCKAKVVPFSIREKLKFGSYVDGDRLVVNDGEKITELCQIQDIKIIGEHNIQNVLAAGTIAFFSGIDPIVIKKGISEFWGVEHRIEFSGEHNGVKYYNDSKGTNTDAAITALKALKENIILIAGGDGKSQNFEPLAKELKGRVKGLILLGRDGKIIGEAARKEGFTEIYYCKDMDECVIKSEKLAVPGDFVLLSPACASWDMYNNYEERGNHFKKCVRELQ